MTGNFSNLTVSVKSPNRIKIIGLYQIEDRSQNHNSLKHNFTIQLLICDPSEYKKCNLKDLFNDIIVYLLSPLTILQSSNVTWLNLSVSVFGYEIKKKFYQKLPIKIYGLDKSLASVDVNTGFAIRVQYYNSSQTSIIMLYGVSHRITSRKFSKRGAKIPAKIRNVEKLFTDPIYFKETGLIVRYVKSVPKNSKELNSILPVYVTAV